MRFTSRQMASLYSSVVIEFAGSVRSNVWLLVLAVLIAAPSPAQDYVSQAGSPAFSVAQPVNFGFVNIANGNLHAEINLADAPQRGGLGFSAKLIYDSRIWQAVKVGGSLVWKPTNIPNSLGGWRFVTSADTGTVTFDTSTTSCDGTSFTNNFSNFVWHSPDGTKRVFPLATAQNQGCGIDVSSADAFASDSSGYHMYVTNYQVATVYAKDGTKVFPTVQDTNGNHFSTDANGNVVDTLGRTVVKKTVSGNQTFFDVLNSQGTTSRITMTTRSILVTTGFSGSQTGITDDQENITIIDSVALPSGDTYSFSYDASVLSSPGLFTAGYGLLKSISLSGGIGEEYTYTNFVDSFGVVNRWATSGGDSTIAYRVISFPGCTPAGPTFCTQGVLLTRNGGTVNYLFTINGGAWNTDLQFDSKGVLAEILTDYDFSQSCSGCLGAAYVRPTRIRETLAGTSETDFAYDSPQNGNVTSIKEWNNYSGTTAPAAPDHQTIIAYSTDPVLIAKNIINRVIVATGQDAAGNQQSQTKYEYDTTALVPLSPSVTNLDTTVDVHRGNLTHISRWAGGTTFLDSYLTYDVSGQVVEAKDSAGNITKLSYADNFFNDSGANPPPSTTPAQATNAYLTSVTSPTSEVTKFGYYFGTGKQAFATDPNGQQTFEHFIDPLDRVTQILAPKGWKALTYDSLLSAQTFTGTTAAQPSTSCTGCIHTSVAVDSHGYVATATLLSDPDGPVSRAFSHDFAGNLLQASNPVRNATQLDVNTNSTSTSYDVMYRPTQTVHPDGSVAKIFYGGQVSAAGGAGAQLCPASTYGIGFPILTIDEAGKKQQLWRDAFGNVIEADEPDGSNALTVSTCYQYNIGGELTQVVQGDLARGYVYDPLWRVQQVTTPEAGKETYSYLNDNGTFCSGDPSSVCKRTDARGIITRYQYDGSGRLTQKTYSDGTPTAVFNYGESSALGVSLTNTVGRLSSAYTLDAAGSKVAGEVFSYDVAGNIIDNSQCTPQNCGTGVFQNSYTSDLIGNVTTFTNSWGRSINTTYDNAGQLTSVNASPSDASHPAAILTNAKYNEFGALASATLGNGLIELMGYSSTSNALSAIRVGPNTPFSQAEPGNIATPAQATLTVSGAVKQVSTTAAAGTATLLLSGTERQVPNGTQSALSSSGTLTITGRETVTPIVQTAAASGSGSVTINGVAQNKQLVLQPATGATGTVPINGTQQSAVVVVQPAASGTDTLTISGTLQSKQSTTPAVPGTGSFTINGTLQTKPATNATPGTGSVTFHGSLQSKSGVGATPAASGTGAIAITGSEGFTTYDPCVVQDGSNCPTNYFDYGSVTITVNGHTDATSYGQGDTAATVATSLAKAINGDGAAFVNASASNGTLHLTARQPGAASNFGWQLSASSGDTNGLFDPNGSFANPASSGTLSGGTNAFGGNTIYDHGTCTATVNGTSYGHTFAQGDTPSTIASGLAPLITAGSLASATASGATLFLSAKQTGSISNYSFSSTCSFNSSMFTSASFTTSTSGPALVGGVNATPAVNDSGTVSLKVGATFNASACYGPSGSCAALSGCPSGDSTGAQLACALASPANPNGLNRAGSPVSANVPAGGSTINIQASSAGTNTNYSLSNSSTFNTASFTTASFSGTLSGANMVGGKDAVTNTIYDSGTTSAIIGGHTISYAWSGSATTAASLASGLAGAINADPGSLVNASVVSPGNVKLTARVTGASTNYPAQASTTFDSADFSASSFSGSLSTSTLTGGADAVSNTVYDSGTATITVNSHTDSAPWSGQGATAAGIASDLATAINADSAAPITASVPAGGTVISLQTKQVGSITDYSLASSSTFDSTHFSIGAFTPSRSSATLAGGTDGVTKPIYDSGTLNLTVGNFTASAPYGPINGISPWEFQGINFGDMGKSASFLGNSNSPYHALYISQGHVHEISYDAAGGNWHDTDLAAAAGVSTAAVNSVAGFAGDANFPEHVFYLNTENGVVSYHVHELYSDVAGGWHDHDISAASGGPNAFSTSALLAFAGNSTFPAHVIYLDTNGHVHELYSDSTGNWHDQDNSAAAIAPAANFNTQTGSSTEMSGSYSPSSSSPEHLFYFNSLPGNPQSGNLHELYSDSTGAWHDRDLTMLTNGPSGYGVLTSCLGPSSSSDEHIFYLGYTSNGVNSSLLGLRHIWQDSSGWHYENTGQPGDDQLTCFFDSNTGSVHVVSGDIPQEGHVHDNWKDTSGIWHTQDITNMAGAPQFSSRFGATLTSFFDGFGAHVFYTGTHLYSASPNASLLASALANDPHTGLNIATSPVRATVTGSTINLVSKTSGGNTNYSLSSSSAFDSANFTVPSYSVTPSGRTLTGGVDAHMSPPSFDFGTFSVTINGHSDIIDWGPGATPASVTSNLVTAINLDSGAAVTASASGNVATFTSKATGANTNYAYVAEVNGASFAFQPNISPPPTLQGGRDANGTVWDSGMINITVSGFSKSVAYGRNDSVSTFAGAIANAFNTDSGSPVWACQCNPSGNSGLVTFTAKKAGSNTNYAISVTSATNSTNFTGTSFPASLSNSTLAGGVDSGGTSNTVSDSGVLSLTVGSFQASVEYGQNVATSSTAPLVCCTAADIATALGSLINQSSDAPVLAAVVGSQISLTSKTGGAATNYTFSATTQSNDSGRFPTPSFGFSAASGTLAGGANKPNPNMGSSSIGAIAFGSAGNWQVPSNTCGAVFVLSVGGHSYNFCFPNVVPIDPVGFASSVAQQINAVSNGSVTASASGSTLSLQSIAGGSNANYPISFAMSPSSPPPLNVAISGPTMTGGTDNGGFVYALDLGTDHAGTIFGANDSVNGNWNYFYDNLNRLQQASTPALGYKYDYDRYGNRLQQTPVNGGNSLSAVYLNNHLVATGVVYDASGNMIQDGNHTYAYDAENRLVSVDNGATATYTYNAGGLRVRSSVGAVFFDFVHDLGGNTVGVLGPGGTLIRQEIGGIATYSDAAYFHHRDWLGNLRAVTDQTGATRKTCTNLPFGDALSCSAAGITPTNFTGYVRDDETSLDFANARYYTSQFGRFTSTDPLGGSLSDPQSMNAYAYALNNPLTYVDPSGMDNCVVVEGGGASSGGCIPSGGGGGDGGGFGGGGSNLGNPTNFGICAFLNCGFGGGSSLPGRPSSAQLANEVAYANSLGPQGYTPLMMPGVVYGNLQTIHDPMQRNWIGGCPLSTCHTYNGLFPPLRPLMVGRGIGSFPAVQALLLGAGPMITALTAPAFTVEEVLASPKLLKGLGPESVEAEIGTTAGWRVEKLGDGSKGGQGWLLREYLSNGESSGRMIRWHPGGSRHYAAPHWTITQPNVPTARVPGGY